MINQKRISIRLNILTSLIIILDQGSCFISPRGVKFYESFVENPRNSEIPAVQFDGLHIRNLTQFQVEHNLTAVERICVNGW